MTNALSEWMDVEVYRNKKAYKMSFHSPEINGKIVSGAIKTLCKSWERLKRRHKGHLHARQACLQKGGI